MTQSTPAPADAIVVLTTTADKKDAESLAQALLLHRLAACVQIAGPMESRYWWNERIESAREYLCLIKTRRERYAEVEKLLLELHPYDVPEIVALPASEISAGYFQWLCGQVKPQA
ncbi:MAG TPA: divalent-cation tolerance protein CutA [Pirellulaceae bacterium]|nr:divalent-cation tolerance protein CutA [Pirellulaceae bacterium]